MMLPVIYASNTKTVKIKMSQILSLDSKAKQSLTRFRKIGFMHACLNLLNKKPNKNMSQKQMEELFHSELESYNKNLSKINYLNESTIHYDNLEKYAEKSIATGILSQGVRINMNLPVDWNAYSEYSRNVRYKLQAFLVLDAPLLFDSKNDDEGMFLNCKNYVLDWIDYYLINDSEDEFCWYDMAVGQRATKFAYITRKTIESQDKTGIEKLLVAAYIHMLDLMNEEKIALHSNHGLFQMAGLLAIGKSLPFMKGANDACKFALEKIEVMLHNHFTKDFLHKEHSPMYHIFMTNYVHLLLESGMTVGSEHFETLAKRAIESAQWLVQPNGLTLPFGDSPPIPVEERAHFEFTKTDKSIHPPGGMKYFSEGGLFINSHLPESHLRSEYLAVNGSFHSRQHKHADDFNFQFCHKGVPLLTDPGTFTYHYDQDERMYVESTRSHNCLEIDGMNYSRYLNDVFGNGIIHVEKLEGCILVECEIKRRKLISSNIPNNKIKTEDAVDVNILHNRKFLYKPENFLLIIDSVDSKNLHQYTQWFQIHPDLRFEENNYRIFNKKRPDQGVKIFNYSTEEKELILLNGEKKPRMQGWISDDGYSLRNCTSLGFSSKSKGFLQLVTLFDLNGDENNSYHYNEGTKGKYFRFVYSKKSQKVDVTYRKKHGNVEFSLSNYDS